MKSKRSTSWLHLTLQNFLTTSNNLPAKHDLKLCMFGNKQTTLENEHFLKMCKASHQQWPPLWPEACKSFPALPLGFHPWKWRRPTLSLPSQLPSFESRLEKEVFISLCFYSGLRGKHWHCFTLKKATFELRVSVESSTAPLAGGNVRFTNTIGSESTVSLHRQNSETWNDDTHTSDIGQVIGCSTCKYILNILPC